MQSIKITLADIVASSQREYQQYLDKIPLAELEKAVSKMPAPADFASAISAQDGGIQPRIIAEIKAKSPSMGALTDNVALLNNFLPQIYSTCIQVGAISYISNQKFFGGSLQGLQNLATKTTKPILRKDFITEFAQILQSRYFGAAAILLMANVIADKSKFAELYACAVENQLAVLCEIHSAAELKIVPPQAQIIGVNCRSFRAGFDPQQKQEIKSTANFALLDEVRHQRGKQVILVAESGLSPANISQLYAKHNFNAALIGTSIITAKNPQALLDELVLAIKNGSL